MTRYRKLLIGSSIALAMGLTACGGGGGYDGPQTSWNSPPPLVSPPPPPPPLPCVPATPWDYC